MADIVWTLDMDFNTTYVSPSIEKVLGFTPEERKRQKFEEMVTPESLEQIMAMFLDKHERDKMQDADSDLSINIEVEYYHKNGSIVWMENNVKAIRDRSNSIIGMYGASHDITDRKKAKNRLRQERDKLQDAIAKIKQLSGLLPVCASCKKIRDDKGYWNQIESYIKDHSDADFSHSICPECAKKHQRGSGKA
ncbi:MAG: PAS domain S-box protein [Deltaproteobacteria bacterium]|nr:PAS domain S-box protein [Deltaproteobacteria bacterium]